MWYDKKYGGSAADLVKFQFNEPEKRRDVREQLQKARELLHAKVILSCGFIHEIRILQLRTEKPELYNNLPYLRTGFCSESVRGCNALCAHNGKEDALGIQGSKALSEELILMQSVIDITWVEWNRDIIKNILCADNDFREGAQAYAKKCQEQIRIDVELAKEQLLNIIDEVFTALDQSESPLMNSGTAS